MDKIIQLFQAISNTLATVKVDDTGGNWQKLIGCRNACAQGIQIVTEMQKGADDNATD